MFISCLKRRSWRDSNNVYRVLSRRVPVSIWDTSNKYKEEAGKSLRIRRERTNGSPGFDKEAREGSGMTVRNTGTPLLLSRGLGCGKNKSRRREVVTQNTGPDCYSPSTSEYVMNLNAGHHSHMFSSPHYWPDGHVDLRVDNVGSPLVSYTFPGAPAEPFPRTSLTR